MRIRSKGAVPEGGGRPFPRPPEPQANGREERGPLRGRPDNVPSPARRGAGAGEI